MRCVLGTKGEIYKLYSTEFEIVKNVKQFQRVGVMTSIILANVRHLSKKYDLITDVVITVSAMNLSDQADRG